MDIKPAKPKATGSEQPLEFADKQPDAAKIESENQELAPDPQKLKFDPPKAGNGGKEPRGNKWLILILILLLLSLAGAGVWFFLLRDDTPASNVEQSSEQAQSNVESPQIPAPSYKLDQIVYGFGVSFQSKADVFIRPAAGGDRESVFDLTKIGTVDWGGLGSAESFVQSEKYAFAVDNKDIYVGDSGNKPQKVYTHPDADAKQGIGIQSVVISPDGSQLAFSVVPAGMAAPQVWTVGADGQGAKMLLDSAKIGPLQWSADNSKLMLGPNILGAGARLDNPQVIDVQTGDATIALEPATPHELSSFAFSSDGTKFAYIKATADQSRATDDIIGYYIGKPYEVHWKDLSTGEDNKVATINENKGPTSVTWQHGEDSFLYSINNRIVKIDTTSGSSTNLYETTTSDAVSILYAADDKTALFGSLQDDQTFTVYSVDLDKKDRKQVMQTTDATVAIGILLK